MSNEDKKVLAEGIKQVSHLYNLEAEEKKATAHAGRMTTEREIADMNMLYSLR